MWSQYDPAVPPHAQSARGSFWWKDIFKLVDTYRSITTSKVSSGQTTLFWKDFWHNNELMCDRYPHLFSYVLNEDYSVAYMSNIEDLSASFALPLSVQAFDELQQINELISEYDLRGY